MRGLLPWRARAAKLARMQMIARILDKPWGRTDLPGSLGAAAGRRVGEVWFEAGDGVLPDVMVKYLFTSERLSIQVHPDDSQARARGHTHGKDEAWVVLRADPGAHIGIGLRQEADVAELRDAALDGSIEDLVDWRPTRAGDIWYNPAGTIHAIGPGLVLAEVQQAIDLTYRLYDYGRPRPLHLDDGLAVATGRPHADRRDGRLPDQGSAVLIDGPHFGLAWCDGAIAPLPANAAGPFQILPIVGTARADGDVVGVWQCASALDADAITLDVGCRALLVWPVR